MKRCVVCTGPLRSRSAGLCSACCRSYDRGGEGDGSVHAAVTWAARRARRFEAAKHRQAETRRTAATEAEQPAPNPLQMTIDDQIAKGGA